MTLDGRGTGGPPARRHSRAEEIAAKKHGEEDTEVLRFGAAAVQGVFSQLIVALAGAVVAEHLQTGGRGDGRGREVGREEARGGGRDKGSTPADSVNLPLVDANYGKRLLVKWAMNSCPPDTPC